MMPLNAAICGVAIVLTCPSEVSPTGTYISSVEIDVTRDTARQHVTNSAGRG